MKLPDGWIFIPKRNDLTIEVEEKSLITCKNCKHAVSWTTISGEFGGYNCESLDMDVDDDFYCAYGEAREYDDDPSHPFADDVMMMDGKDEDK